MIGKLPSFTSVLEKCKNKKSGLYRFAASLLWISNFGHFYLFKAKLLCIRLII